VSAVDALLDVLSDLRGLELPAHDVFGPTTMNIGTISGGVALNVTAPSAEASILFRVIGRADDLRGLVERTVAGRAAIECGYSSDAMFMEKLDGFESTVVAFTADVSVLTNWGKPLLFGPGSILDAHTDHEKIGKADLVAAVDSYKRMVIALQDLDRASAT
jgi:acetylornithine deacetylase